MLNIFNLFLFLLTLWVMFMIASSKVSWLYVFFGILASLLVSISSYRIKLVEEKSELLHLSFGFYRHFVKIFLKGFVSSLKLIITLALSRKAPSPLIYSIKLGKESQINPALLMASFNMTTGLFCIGVKEDEILVHAIDEAHFKKFDLQKICKSLKNINDDNLV